jgi:hypothetical protein
MTLLTNLLTSNGTNANRGTVATGSTLTFDSSDGYFHTTRIAVSTTLPAIAGGANLGVGKLIYTFPAGAIVINSSYMSVAITQTQGNITADTPEIGLGTVIASGAVAVLSGTATFEDVLTGQVAADCNGTATVALVGTQLLIPAAGVHTLHINVADGWAASGDAAALLVGTVTFNWTILA